jgi:chromosome segregation ATPase
MAHLLDAIGQAVADAIQEATKPLREKNQRLEQTLSDLETKFQRLHEARRKEIAELVGKVRSHETTITLQGSELTKAFTELGDMQKKNKEMKPQLTALINSNKSERARTNSLHEQLQALKADLTSLETTNTTLATQILTSKSDQETTGSQVDRNSNQDLTATDLDLTTRTSGFYAPPETWPLPKVVTPRKRGANARFIDENGAPADGVEGDNADDVLGMLYSLPQIKQPMLTLRQALTTMT